MKTKLIITLLVMVLVTTACLADNSSGIPVNDYSRRISGTGLSLLPPQEKDWIIVPNLPQGGINFAKQGSPVTETYSCSVLVVPYNKRFNTPDEFEQFVKQIHEADNNRKRFIDYRTEYKLNTRFAPYCVEYTLSATDTKPNNKIKGPLVLKVKGYIFVYPEAPDFIVNIIYSERGTNKEFSSSFKVLGEQFIDNIQISPEDKINFSCQLYVELNRPDLSEPLYEAALETYKKTGNELGVAEIYRTYACFLSSDAVARNKKAFLTKGFELDKTVTFDNRIQKAKEYFLMAKDIFERNGNYNNHLNIYNNLGCLYYQEKDKEKAIEAFNKCLEDYRKIKKEHPDVDIDAQVGFSNYEEQVLAQIKQVERLK